MPGSLHTPTFVHGRVLVVAPVRRGSQGITATDTLETRAVLTTHDLDSTQSVAEQSGRNRPPNPAETGHPFRLIPATPAR